MIQLLLQQNVSSGPSAFIRSFYRGDGSVVSVTRSRLSTCLLLLPDCFWRTHSSLFCFCYAQCLEGK